MEQRLLRTAVIVVLMALAGGLALRHRAGQVARRAETSRVLRDSLVAAAAAANPESVRVVTAAIAAYDADRRARGVPPLAVRVLSYEPDRDAVLVTLLPEQLVEGGDAVIRVGRDGRAIVVRFSP